MKRDTVKTLAGLLVIGVIVVATFLYGNAQRRSQLKHDQDVKRQQDAKSAEQARKAQPSASAQATGTPLAGGQQANNTAPVKSPTSNDLQGSNKGTPTPAATPKPSPSATPGQVAGAQTTPVAGAKDPLPETGSPLAGLLGATAVLGAAVALRRSKRAVYQAARSHR
jgi:LPXTG-motif cell wall-anchored protein